ncbi:MAG: HlyC/CorC family transporter [Desulfobacteraceae bacterium]|nr:MAG: HlyC/CorC family transporter [Desulfobacteraceae bacterium]
MSVILFEVLIIGLLVAVNGILAMSEMAVVSSRKARLQHLANSGQRSALAALDLANNPDRFLSTVQIGITLVGILAGAFGGSTIAVEISIHLSRISLLAPYAEGLGLGIVVLVITYLSLVFGELIPKRLALNHPERIAFLVAIPMKMLATIASPFVWVLSVSTGTVLRLLGVHQPSDALVSEEEIKLMIDQGTQAGIFEETEQDMVENVFRLGDRRVKSLMTPRFDIVWLDIEDPEETIIKMVSESHLSRFPVCRGSIDHVIGVVKARDYLAAKLANPNASLNDHLKQPLIVPENSVVLNILEMLKISNTHMSLVVDEYGSLRGLFTTNDILEAIVGDLLLASGHSDNYVAIQREDNSWLIDGAFPIDEFKELFSIGTIAGEEHSGFQTLAGFIFMHLGAVPTVSDHFEWNGIRFEIMDMDGNRIDKVLVTRLAV